MSRPASWIAAMRTQSVMELRLTARRGENLLAIAVIPVAVRTVSVPDASVLNHPPERSALIILCCKLEVLADQRLAWGMRDAVAPASVARVEPTELRWL